MAEQLCIMLEDDTRILDLVNEDGLAHYSREPAEMIIDSLNVDKEDGEPRWKILPLSEAFHKLRANVLRTYAKGPTALKEITRRQYFEALESMPPERGWSSTYVGMRVGGFQHAELVIQDVANFYAWCGSSDSKSADARYFLFQERVSLFSPRETALSVIKFIHSRKSGIADVHEARVRLLRGLGISELATLISVEQTIWEDLDSDICAVVEAHIGADVIEEWRKKCHIRPSEYVRELAAFAAGQAPHLNLTLPDIELAFS